MRGLYRGGMITASREAPGSGVLLAVKDGLETKFGLHDENDQAFRITKKIFASGVAGLCAWCVSIPLDTVKTIVQSDPEKKKSVWQTTQALYKQGGMTVFYKGLIPQAVRIFPQSATLLLVYEYMHSALT